MKPQQVKSTILCLVLAFFGLVTVISVHAGVNLKNGNFYISYTDTRIHSDPDIEISRTYNSRASSVGWFGYGWGSDYETRLVVEYDGTLTIHNNGSGAMNVYIQQDIPLAEIESAVESILRAWPVYAQEHSTSLKPPTRALLLNAIEWRRVYMRPLVEGGYLPRRSVPVGAIFKDVRGGTEWLLRTHEGYQRYSGGMNATLDDTPFGTCKCNSKDILEQKVESFDDAGRLVRVDHGKGGSYVVVERDARGNPTRIVDGQDNAIAIHTDAQGRVIGTKLKDGRSSHYRYEGNRLVESFDIGPNRYLYSYDVNANMTGIRYEDNMTLTIGYIPEKQMVESITSRSGKTEWYEYFADAQNPGNHYGTRVYALGPEGRRIINGQEYFMAVTPGGIDYTMRRIEEKLGEIKDFTFRSDGQPIRTLEKGVETHFDYDSFGRRIRKSDNREITEWAYPETGVLPIYWASYAKSDPDQKVWNKYAYNQRGRLVQLDSATGDQFLFHYDETNRLSGLSRAGRTLNLTYQGNGFLESIELAGEGKLTFSYKHAEPDQYKKSDSAAPTLEAHIKDMLVGVQDRLNPAGLKLDFLHKAIALIKP